MSQRQKVELTLNIGDEPAALRFGADSTAIIVDSAVVTLEGSLQQRQALVLSMARALGLVFVQHGPVPAEVDPVSPATREEEGEELFRRITTKPAPATA